MPDQVCGYVFLRAHIKSYASCKNDGTSRENFMNSAHLRVKRKTCAIAHLAQAVKFYARRGVNARRPLR